MTFRAIVCHRLETAEGEIQCCEAEFVVAKDLDEARAKLDIDGDREELADLRPAA
ncbi:MAG: hypothetical protein H7841_12220 [Magnetospirillum sp. WYHS-4]